MEGVEGAGSGSQQLLEELSQLLVQASGSIQTVKPVSFPNFDWVLETEKGSQEFRTKCTSVNHRRSIDKKSFGHTSSLKETKYRYLSLYCRDFCFVLYLSRHTLYCAIIQS